MGETRQEQQLSLRVMYTANSKVLHFQKPFSSCDEHFRGKMLVKNQKYVKVAKTEEGYEDFNTFLQKVIEKLGLPLQSELRLADESGTEVDADVFEELLQAGNLTVTVSTEQSIGKIYYYLILMGKQWIISDKCGEGQIILSLYVHILNCVTVVLHEHVSHTTSPVSDISSSSVSENSIRLVSSDSSDATVIIKTNGGKRTHAERESAKEMVGDALHSKPGLYLQNIFINIWEEYDKTKTLTDRTRRQMVNLLVADMTEVHGRIPPTSVCMKYALGIISVFPSLRDPYSDNGYEHFYDPQSGPGYLAWRLKTV
ncbi:uncharacterized protein LOC131364868 isoform X1 [Hemibagrus wyckioides]|uniref:uncharacterized protein LOC131364868 isoform X1 n=1 Tax=Hemibagrus wyckioides TaxID=337641 RepID=UPI00266BDA96|nr:uncharacterized protein LOC131364868 isoform X1 [Hemibagrus wyckioides]